MRTIILTVTGAHTPRIWRQKAQNLGEKLKGATNAAGRIKRYKKTKALEEGRHQWSEINEVRDRKDMCAAISC